MSCVAAVVHDGKVYMGGDSAASNGYDVTVRADGKVFRVGEFLIGSCGSVRMKQLLHYNLLTPPIAPDADLMRYMVLVFIEEVRRCFKAGGFATKVNEQEDGGTFLVAARGRLFCIQDDYQVGEALAPYDAIGCGDNVAKGALFATAGQPPETRIRLALEASAHWNEGVRPPFTILSLPAE